MRDVRAGVRHGLVEADAGNITVLVACELDAQLYRAAVLGIDDRRRLAGKKLIGGRRRRRSESRRGEYRGEIGGQSVPGRVFNATAAALDANGIRRGVAERGRGCERRGVVRGIER